MNNFLSDVPSVFISTDNVDADRLKQAQRWRVSDVRRFMVVFGLVSTAFDLVTFIVLLKFFRADEPTFQTAWFVVSLLTELVVVLVLRTDGPAIRSAPSSLILWSTVAVIVVALCTPYLGPVTALSGFVPLPLAVLGAGVATAVGYALSTEAAKAWFFRPLVTRH